MKSNYNCMVKIGNQRHNTFYNRKNNDMAKMNKKLIMF